MQLEAPSWVRMLENEGVSPLDCQVPVVNAEEGRLLWVLCMAEALLPYWQGLCALFSSTWSLPGTIKVGKGVRTSQLTSDNYLSST